MKAEEVKLKRVTPKRIIFYIKILLILIIALLLLNKFYIVRNKIDIQYGRESFGLLNFFKKYFPDIQEKKVSLLIVFNQLPVMTDIENISKIYTKHKDNIGFFPIFHRKFKTPFNITFPYKNLTGSSLTCNLRWEYV